MRITNPRSGLGIRERRPLGGVFCPKRIEPLRDRRFIAGDEPVAIAVGRTRLQFRSRDRRDATLNTTALVHEAYLKLVDGDRLPFDGRAHFFSAAARAMRQVIVDDARKRNRIKRGGGQRPTSLDRIGEVGGDEPAEEILALDEALVRFEAFDERAARVVECRYFAGLTVEETAEALSISPTTVKREWAAARAWLYRALANG